MKNDAAAQLISPPPGGHLPPLYHTQVTFPRAQNSKYIYKKILGTLIDKPKTYLFSVDIQRGSGSLNTPLSLPYISLMLSIICYQCQAHSDDQSHVGCLLSG